MLKVFLVEDESLIREGLRDNIPWEQYGYQFVGEAGDGEMALPLIRKTQPDLLITDIKMPFMDGLSLSKIVSEEFPKTKIIIISGYDDFEYARQAIEAGVEQYLLKPITRMKLRKTLLEMKEKIEKEQDKDDYQLQYQEEMHEYEQFSRRRFFEMLLEGELSVKEIYDEAAKCSLELSASGYNLLFLYMQEKVGEGTTKEFVRVQEEVLHYFLRHPQHILFRWNVNCYGVLIKADADLIDEVTERGVYQIKKVCEAGSEYLEWYVAVGNKVERLSQLHECYESVNQYFAWRFLEPQMHILNKESLADYLQTPEEKNLNRVEPGKMDPDIIRDFLNRGNKEEVSDFVQSYLQGIGEALNSRMFRDYVILNVRFTVLSYVESFGYSQEELEKEMEYPQQEKYSGSEEVRRYLVDILRAAVVLREKDSSNQSGKSLKHALEYIAENYDQETLTLSSVADAVKVSTNYLSAVFSQTMQKTFVEYVTEKRMEKAKKLLRTTDKPAGTIATEVGYKDSHYFSFVFKKTLGVTPREYRSKKELW